MSNFLAEPCRRSQHSNEKENEIREIFYSHWKDMKKQMKVTIDRINRWCSQSIQNINTYADEQVRILKDDYDHLRLDFNHMRKANLETANAYHASKESDLFRQLCDTCRFLKFQVAELEYVKNEVERPKVVVFGGQVSRKQQEKINTHTPELQKREERSTVKDATEMEYDGGEKANSSSKTTSSISNGTHNQSSMTPFSYYNGISTGSNGNPEARSINNDDSNNKCPVCFMIFPLNMTHNDRRQHVGEHFADDQDIEVLKV